MPKNPVGRTNPYIDRSLDVLVPLVKAGTPLPKKALGLSTFRANKMESAGLIRRLKAEKVRTGRAGRPADLFVATYDAKRAVQRREASGKIAA